MNMNKNKNMNKTTILHRQKGKWLAGAVSFAVLLSGSASSALAAETASTTAAIEQPTSVLAATYSTPAPLAATPDAGLQTPLPLPPLAPPQRELSHEELSSVLQISHDQLHQALESGQSVYELAAARGSDVLQQLLASAENRLKTSLARELSDGRITDAQYQSRLGEVTARAEAELKRTPPKPPVPGAEAAPVAGGPLLGPGLDQLDSAKLLSLLGLSAEQLTSQVQVGQSLADIATAQGVDSQKLIDAAAQAFLAQLDQEASEKRIWSDEYAARKQDISQRAADAVQHKHHVLPLR